MDRTVELGQVVVERLVREPVKESVKEALAAERTAATEPRAGEGQFEAPDEGDRRSRESGGRKKRILRPRRLLTVVGLALAAVLVKRRLSGDDGSDEFDPVGGTEGDRGTAGSAGSDHTTSPVSDGGTSSGPGSTRASSSGDDWSEEGAD